MWMALIKSSIDLNSGERGIVFYDIDYISWYYSIKKHAVLITKALHPIMRALAKVKMIIDGQ